MMNAMTTAVRSDRARAKTPADDSHLTVGERTRHTILEEAVDLASAEGLEGLTIGRLSTELGMSKSGLFGHFGSKEELQLATIEHAREIIVNAVILPAIAAPRGVARLLAFGQNWLSYVQRGVFRGGCFIAAAAAEFDGRPGPVRDRIAGMMKEWLDALEVAVHKAKEEGDLHPDVDPAQLAFEINALGMAANANFQLLGDRRSFARARRAIIDRIERAATPRGQEILKSIDKNKSTAPSA